MSPSNRQIIADAYAAFARGDAPAVLGAFSPDIVWREAENHIYADGNPYIGPASVAQGVFGRIMTEWNGFEVRPEHYVAEGNTVVAVGRYVGTYGATGQYLDATFVHVWTIRDGKVTAFQQHTDTLQFARVMRADAPISA